MYMYVQYIYKPYTVHVHFKRHLCPLYFIVPLKSSLITVPQTKLLQELPVEDKSLLQTFHSSLNKSVIRVEACP